MAYADYTYYRETCGGTMPETDFARLSRQASAWLDQVTFGRIRDAWPDDSRVKDACCAAADILYRAEQGGEVASASNDGYSETYATSGQTAEQKLHAAAAQYLAMTGLLYQGVFRPC